MAKAIVEITGAIWKIGREEKIGDRFNRKFLVKELNVPNPNVWGLEMWHENTMLLNDFKEAQVVTCKVVVMGRHYEDRVTKEDKSYTILQCIEIKLS